MLIINLVKGRRGWDPINYMITLAAELMEAQVLDLAHDRDSFLPRLLAVLARRRQGRGTESCLVVCASAADLVQFFRVPNWRKRFRFIAAWIFDSFWVDWMPRSVLLSQPFDHIYVSTAEDIPAWKSALAAPTTWLPWGSDVLRLGGNGAVREWDLTRVGRQPPDWDDDVETARSAARLNIRFHPRPQDRLTPVDNQKSLMDLYCHTKFLLAFSNIDNPTNYTHPLRQYLTGRWVDALAGGAVVAGSTPREPSIEELLWPGATVDFGSVRRTEGLSTIVNELHAWTPEVARNNHAFALARLDWRLRFKTIADDLGESPQKLAAELRVLEERTRTQRLLT